MRERESEKGGGWVCERGRAVLTRRRAPPPPPIFRISFSAYSGAHGVVAAALVALKQVTPDSEVTLLGAFKFRVRVS